MMQQRQAQLQENSIALPTAVQIAAATTQLVGQVGVLDIETAGMFKALMESIMRKLSNNKENSE